MASTSSAFEAVRSSRGYLFSVVACAALLSTLAIFQSLQGPAGIRSWTIALELATIPFEEVPTDAAPIGAVLLSDAVLAQVRAETVASVDATGLETGTRLRRCLLASEEARENGSRRVRITYSGRYPEGGAFLESLAAAVVREHRRELQAHATSRLRTAEARLESTRLEHATALQQAEQLTGDLQRLRNEIKASQDHIEELQDRADRLARQAPAAAAPAVAERTVNPQVAALEQSLAQLHAQRLTLLNQYTIRHPLVLDLDHRIAEVSTALEDLRPSEQPRPQFTATVAAAAEADPRTIEELSAAKSKLERMIAELAAQETAAPERTSRASVVAEQLRSSEAEVERAKDVLEQLDDQPLQAAAAKAVATPAGPLQSRAVSLVVSLGLGCILGGVAYVRAGTASRRLNSRAQIESILALPVIGLMPATDETASLPPLELPPATRKVRLVAEMTMGLFLITTTLAAVVCEGYAAHLASQPLSAIADSLRELVGNGRIHR